MTEDLRRRLDAVERAITESDRAVADLADASELQERLDALEDETDDLETRLADLEAAVRALRAVVGRRHGTAGSPDPADASDTDPSDRANHRDADAGASASDRERGAAPGRTDRLRPGEGGDERAPPGAESLDEEWEWAGDRAESADDPDGRGDADRRRDDDPGRDSTDETRRLRAPERDHDARRERARDGPQSDAGHGSVVERRAEHAGGGDQSRRDAAPARDDGHARTAAGGTQPGREAPDGHAAESRWPAETRDGDWRATGREWPEEREAPPADDRRPDAETDWPEGIDVDRAEPWSVPDPPTVTEPSEDDSEAGFVERLRDAL